MVFIYKIVRYEFKMEGTEESEFLKQGLPTLLLLIVGQDNSLFLMSVLCIVQSILNLFLVDSSGTSPSEYEKYLQTLPNVLWGSKIIHI